MSIKSIAAAVAGRAANKPIHVVISAVLLALVAYLSVVDDYAPDGLLSDSAAFYHAPKGSWTRVDDATVFADADSYTVVPLRFGRHDVPEIEGVFSGPVAGDRFLVSPSDEVSERLAGIARITAHGTVLAARRSTKISKYYDYVHAGFQRLQSAFRGAEPFDIGLITVAYVAMWYTLIRVFVDMRTNAGLSFWLAFATLTLLTFGFLFALVTTTRVLDAQVPLLSITEGIPFLVAIIGFKHKVSIALAVLRGSAGSDDAATIVAGAIAAHTTSLLRDHLLVVGALLACAAYAHHLEGLRNFCVLSALILAFDLALTYTFYAGVLTLKVEINRARRTDDLRGALEEDGVLLLVAASVAAQAAADERPHEKPLFSPRSTLVLSFKVAMVAGFFGFHAFWLGSSWMHNKGPTSVDEGFSHTAAKHISVGVHGAVATVLSPRVYRPQGAILTVEDVVLLLLEQVSRAIRDSLISKCLLFVFAISIFTNAYLLNATRYQVLATNKLLAEEIARPKQQAQKPVEKPVEVPEPAQARPLEECLAVLQSGGIKTLANSEISSLVVAGKLPLYSLEKQLADTTRAVAVRRKAIAAISGVPAVDSDRLPYLHYDYDRVFGACCENVIGYIPLPIGVAGPLLIDGKPFHIPLATTEGCLVASTMRGCKAINAGGGVETVLTQDGMTRGPCVTFPSLKRAGAAKLWLDSDEGQRIIKKAFNSTLRFARLQHIKTALAGTLLFIRFRTTTGDAMGMNMISKGVEHSLKYMAAECGWEDMDVISLSGNYCTDKKAAAINWIEGRGKSIVAEARVPGEVVRKVLKSDVAALVELNTSKNLVGSAMAGSIGGFNAQAANLVTAVYLACGQDPAQNVELSNCITLMSKVGDDLQISVSMPSIEVGTIGGGTILEPQGAILDLLGVRGPHPTSPGDNARQLAKIVALAVLAAELSLCSALAAGHLVQSHMTHNRAAAAPAANAGNGTLSPEDAKRLAEGSVTCIKS